MHTTLTNPLPSLQQLLRECPLSGAAPVEIHGARALGCNPNDDFLFQGFKYVLDANRDVLVREDIHRWIQARRILN
ncbi:hypothetical protein [Rugamonas apoptosis]|uniref:Uncharacterized protein n=1 Tax=Rugamonas apoptosis TaxID=2758570 RepID=A0A7W2FEX5_9BURK|nr:hypothetical protein [Rugamonas apoptosis]MBA5690476.1 hypothetical protein [Rugamonas apoptosis]